MVTTRRNNDEQRGAHEDVSESHTIPQPTDLVPSTTLSETLAEKRLRWASLVHAYEYQIVITQVLAEEMPKYSRSSVIPTSLPTIMRECVLILASAPLIFTAAVNGLLASQFRTSELLQREYSEIQSRANMQPSIYIHLLADSNGVAPSANQYMLIRDIVLRYVSDLEPDPVLSHLIDNISSPTVSMSSTMQGYRKYLWTRRLSPGRVATIFRFCAGVEARCIETPEQQRDTPFLHPPGECGYALNSHTRLRQHRRRQSSNYVMNLVEDICTHLHTSGILPTKFFMHQFIIYLIFKPEQVRIAEIFCSGLLQVWVENGGGFNHWPAGLSCASGDRVTRAEWREHERRVKEGSELERTLGRLRERAEEAVGELEEDEGECWRRALESGSEDEEIHDAKDRDHEPGPRDEEMVWMRTNDE
jgi:hypothetical protein